jgi:uncharacterized membrane protein
MTETKRPRGRPRPEATIARDREILKYLGLNGPQTRNGLSEALGLPKTIVYLALSRLRDQGHVRTCADTSGSSTIWSSEVNAPCP